VVVEQQRRYAGEERIGACTEIEDEQSLRSAGAEAIQYGRGPGGLGLEADLCSNGGVAGKVERADKDGGGGQAVGVGVGEDVDAGGEAVRESVEEVKELRADEVHRLNGRGHGCGMRGISKEADP